MLSQETINIIKSTVPALEQHRNTIGRVFYQHLFARHPELKSMFNMTHQAQGIQQQVLANAVFQYAKYIDRPEILRSGITAITEKHASLNVTPVMYEAVGESLLAAMAEVLGDAITPPVVEAWTQAYAQLAAILANREEAIYLEREQVAGGFRGQKPFVITKKVEESEVITSFYLQPKDGQVAPPFVPGQYVAITVDNQHAHRHTRNYSLSDAPSDDHLRISIKREEDGVVSRYLHRQADVGDELLLGMPSGVFTLQDTPRPVVLIAGGVGITPLLAMYKQLVQHSDCEVVLVQCAKNSRTLAFREEIVSHRREHVRHVVVYSEPLATDQPSIDYDFTGFLTTDLLRPLLPSEDAEYYFCGPKPFMTIVLQILTSLSIDKSRVHYEFFGPSEELENVTL